MKKQYFLILLALPLIVLLYNNMNISNPWITDYEIAKKESKNSGRPILIYFSGSDWCGQCIKMKKEILETDAFKEYSDKNLVLLLADFPRMKKNKLDDNLTKQNESLADKYNSSGVFPYLLLLNQDGKILKEWKGYPNIKPEAFIEQINQCKKPI